MQCDLVNLGRGEEGVDGLLPPGGASAAVLLVPELGHPDAHEAQRQRPHLIHELGRKFKVFKVYILNLMLSKVNNRVFSIAKQLQDGASGQQRSSNFKVYILKFNVLLENRGFS